MPNKVADNKCRVSYLEWKDIHADMKLMAEAERIDLSDLIRRATSEYISRHLQLRSARKKPAKTE